MISFKKFNLFNNQTGASLTSTCKQFRIPSQQMSVSKTIRCWPWVRNSVYLLVRPSVHPTDHYAGNQATHWFSVHPSLHTQNFPVFSGECVEWMNWNFACWYGISWLCELIKFWSWFVDFSNFAMLMYPDHLQGGLDFRRSLLIFHDFVTILT